MKFKIIIVFLFIFVSVLFSEEPVSQVDLYSYDFFGFKMNYSQDQIIAELKKQNKKYKVEENSDRFFNEIKYIDIFPQDFNEFENQNVDYFFSIYKGNIFALSKYNIEKSFLDKLLKEIKNYITIPNINQTTKEYRTKDFIIIYEEKNIADVKNHLIITNANIKKELWEWSLSKYTVPVYKVNDVNANLYTSSKKEFIRNLEFGEKVALVEIEKKDRINGKEGNWVRVETAYNEFGYVFSIYLEEIKKNNTGKILYYAPTITNLRFRESPKLDGKFIRLLVKGEKLELLERGKEEMINGVKGSWLKVKTEKGETGWAFSGYLEEIK